MVCVCFVDAVLNLASACAKERGGIRGGTWGEREGGRRGGGRGGCGSARGNLEVSQGGGGTTFPPQASTPHPKHKVHVTTFFFHPFPESHIRTCK